MKKFEVGKIYSNFWRQCFEDGTAIPLGVPMIRVAKRAGNRLYCVRVTGQGETHNEFKEYFIAKIKGDQEAIKDGLATYYASCEVEKYSDCVRSLTGAAHVLANGCA